MRRWQKYAKSDAMWDDANFREAGMRVALAAADRASAIDEVPIGAALFVEGAWHEGHNLRETRAVSFAHAEMEALAAYHAAHGAWRLPVGSILFVTAEPCLMCTGALLQARLDFLVYGCRDPKNAGLRRMLESIDAGVFDHRFKGVADGVLADEASMRLTEYFRRKR